MLMKLDERTRVWLMLAPALAVIMVLFMGGLVMGSIAEPGVHAGDRPIRVFG